MPRDIDRSQDRHQRGECWRLSWRPEGPYYALKWVPSAGRWLRRSTGCTVRRAAAEVAARWLQEGERQAAGLRTGVDHAAGVQLAQHVRAYLESRRNAPEGLTGQHISQLAANLQRVMRQAGWRWLADVSEDGLHAAMAALSASSRRKRGWSAATRNHCLVAWGSFCRWAVRDGRMPTNPLANLKTVRVDGFRSFERRALTRDEAERLLVATEAGPEMVGLSGPDRAMLYRLALVTGFRRGELASLTAASCRLDGPTPMVLLSARAAKGRKDAQQPLPPWVVPQLRRWLAGRPRHAPLWPGIPACMSAVVRADAKAAGVAAVSQDGGRLDFHALRHTFGTWLAQAGVTPQAAQRLMRHANVQLTMRVYTHLGLEELAASAAKLDMACCTVVALPQPTTDDHRGPGAEGSAVQAGAHPAQDAGNGDDHAGSTEDHGEPRMTETSEMAWPGFEPGSRQLETEYQSIGAPRLAEPPASGVAQPLHSSDRVDRRHARDRAEAGEEPDLALAVARIEALGAMQKGGGRG